MVLSHLSIHPTMKNCCCCNHPLSLWSNTLHWHHIKYCFHLVYLIKMKVLTYTSYKEHCDLYTKIHGSIAINSCQIELTQKYIILLSEVSIMIYKADKRTSIETLISYILTSQQVLIQLMILMPKSYNKDKSKRS